MRMWSGLCSVMSRCSISIWVSERLPVEGVGVSFVALKRSASFEGRQYASCALHEMQCACLVPTPANNNFIFFKMFSK
jgi:hypothetical protein